MSYKADNAIIMAAGASSRFVPLSFEKPKALITVKNEILLERQIRQLQEAGIGQIVIVAGYKKEQFYYLQEKLGVTVVENEEYRVRNNHSSIYAARNYLKNSYICSADNYFTVNPFQAEVEEPYYAALYADGETKEWCMRTDQQGYVDHIQIGGSDSWYMMGHAFWNEEFSKKFVEILSAEYMLPETAGLLWEAVYMKHLSELKLKIRKYSSDFIFEFDSLDELRAFDQTYKKDTRSVILKKIAEELRCSEEELTNFHAVKTSGGTEASGFFFDCRSEQYQYSYKEKKWRKAACREKL